MSKLVQRRWVADDAAGLPRRDRAPCSYKAYVPDPLVVASSRIEGLEVGGRRLLRAEAATALGEDSRDVTATEVLGNIQAMTWALGVVRRGDDITVDHLLEAHRRLLAGTRLHEFAGLIRDDQNWIGGSGYNP